MWGKSDRKKDGTAALKPAYKGLMVQVGLNGLAFEKCLKPLENLIDFETQQIIHLQEIKHNLLITHEDWCGDWTQYHHLNKYTLTNACSFISSI